MNREAKHIQPGYTTVTPYLHAKLDLIDFLQRAFGAEVTQALQWAWVPARSESRRTSPGVIVWLV